MSVSVIDYINIGDETFNQVIDTETDTVTIQDENEVTKMTITRDAVVYDEKGQRIGKFKLASITGKYIWEYVADDLSLQRTFLKDLIASERDLFEILYRKAQADLKEATNGN